MDKSVKVDFYLNLLGRMNHSIYGKSNSMSKNIHSNYELRFMSVNKYMGSLDSVVFFVSIFRSI